MTEPRKGWGPAAPSPATLYTLHTSAYGMGTFHSWVLTPLGTKASKRRTWQGTEVEAGSGAGWGGRLEKTSPRWLRLGLPRAHQSQQPVLGP